MVRATPTRMSTPPTIVVTGGIEPKMITARIAVIGASPRNDSDTRSAWTWRSAQLYTVWPPIVHTTARPRQVAATRADGMCAWPPDRAATAPTSATTAYTDAE